MSISARIIAHAIATAALISAIAACSNQQGDPSARFHLVSTSQNAPLLASAILSDDQPPTTPATVGNAPIFAVSGPREQIDVPCVEPASLSAKAFFEQLEPSTVVYTVNAGTNVTISAKPPGAGDIITIELPHGEYGYTCALYFYPPPPPAPAPTPT